MRIKIAELKTAGLQARAEMDASTVAEYAALMRDGAKLPPVVVFTDPADGARYLADGFHRVAAATAAGLLAVDADIREGGFVDALRYALGCNARHGLRLTNEDKRSALRLAWENRRALFGANDPTADWLAEVCGLSRDTAQGFYREQICRNPTDMTPQRQAANGRVYTMPPRRVPVRHELTPNAAAPEMPARPAAQVPTAATAQAVPAGEYTYPDGTVHFVPPDRFGHEIPVPLLPAFDGAERVRQLAHKIAEVQRTVRAAYGDNGHQPDPAFAAVRQEIETHLANAHLCAKGALPFCVCRVCQGTGCGACRGRGWQTRDEYERNPSEYKAVAP